MSQTGNHVRYAVPVEAAGDGGVQVCAHFGHCGQFLMFEVDPAAKTICGVTSLTPPPHERGVLPRWLHEEGANVVLTGGMGWRAIEMLRQSGIEVVTGVTSGTPEEVVLAHLNGTLAVADNACDH